MYRLTNPVTVISNPNKDGINNFLFSSLDSNLEINQLVFGTISLPNIIIKESNYGDGTSNTASEVSSLSNITVLFRVISQDANLSYILRAYSYDDVSLEYLYNELNRIEGKIDNIQSLDNSISTHMIIDNQRGAS